MSELSRLRATLEDILMQARSCVDRGDSVSATWLVQRLEGALHAFPAGPDGCSGYGPNGKYVRYCPIHGLRGAAPR